MGSRVPLMRTHALGDATQLQACIKPRPSRIVTARDESIPEIPTGLVGHVGFP